VARRVWAAQPAAAFWAGARFYDRYDVHITDFWFRDPSGFGGGVEDVALGRRAKLAVAWIGGTQDQRDPSGSVPPESCSASTRTGWTCASTRSGWAAV
jgi:maltoporin